MELLKRYYSLDEAKAFLSVELKQPFSDRDIVDMVKRKKIDLCFFGTYTFSLFHPLVSMDGPMHVPGSPVVFVEAYYRVSSLDLLDSIEIPVVVRYPEIVDELDGPFFTDESKVKKLLNDLDFSQSMSLKWMPCDQADVSSDDAAHHKPKALRITREEYVLPPDGHPNSPTCGHLKFPHPPVA